MAPGAQSTQATTQQVAQWPLARARALALASPRIQFQDLCVVGDSARLGQAGTLLDPAVGLEAAALGDGQHSSQDVQVPVFARPEVVRSDEGAPVVWGVAHPVIAADE